jgi:hypothetical protein
MSAMSDEITRLRQVVSQQNLTLTDEERRTVSDDNTHMATARLSAANTWLQDEIRRLRLTAEEREAIKVCESDYSDNDMDAACWKIAATLRGLLSRTGTNSRQTGDNAAKCTDQERKTPEREHRND